MIETIINILTISFYILVGITLEWFNKECNSDYKFHFIPACIRVLLWPGFIIFGSNDFN